MMNTRLLYFYDALCGWCYGFSPQLKAFLANHPNLDVEVLSGGMVRGDRIGPLSDMRSFLKEAYPKVEELSGVKFGEAYKNVLAEGDMILGSEEASRFLCAFKSILPDQQFNAAHALQQMIYHDGLEPVSKASYEYVLDHSFPSNKEEILAAFEHPTSEQMMQEEFNLVERFGIGGFPSVVLEHKEQYFLMAKGYTTTETLEKVYNSILNAEDGDSDK